MPSMTLKSIMACKSQLYGSRGHQDVHEPSVAASNARVAW